MHHFANLAIGDNFARQLAGRVLHIVETHQRFNPLGASGLHHFSGVFGVQRQRFFRINVFAVTNRFQRHLLMQEIRRADIHHINSRIGHQLAPVGGRTRETKFRSALLRQLRRHFRQHFQHQFPLQWKYRGSLRISNSVAAPNVAGAN
ncbi:hypothetical protein D3C72_764960 [compost metagenome]